jgi:hypothetical protein
MGLSITGRVSISGNMSIITTEAPSSPQNIVVISTVTNTGAGIPNSTNYGIFNGTNQYLGISGTTALGTCNFTAEAWVYINNTGTYTIYATGGGSTGGIYMGIHGDGRPYAAVGTTFGTAGEGSSLTLTTPAGYVMTSIIYGSYGRTTCSGPAGCWTRSPSQSTGPEKRALVENYFIGKGTATVPADNAIWGDPAPGVGGKALSVVATHGLMGTTSSLAVRAWNHLALVRSGTGANQTKFYVNGISVSSATLATNYTVGTNFSIGTTVYPDTPTGVLFHSGYLSNTRVVKGVDVYSNNFTPPPLPLASTQDSGTNIRAIATATLVQFLTLQGTTIVDTGGNSRTVVNNGTVAMAPGVIVVGSASTASAGGSNIVDVFVSWTAPANPGTFGIDSYTVSSTPLTTATFTTATILPYTVRSDVTSLQVTGLNTFTYYTFNVSANTIAGAGNAITSSTIFYNNSGTAVILSTSTYPNLPIAPTIGVQSAAGTTVVILVNSATVAVSTATLPTYSVTVTANPGGISRTLYSSLAGVFPVVSTFNSTGTLTFSGLAANTNYTFSAQAVNAIGYSTNAVSTSTTTGAAPSSSLFTFPGSYTWIAPAGVTSISVVAVGGGGTGRQQCGGQVSGGASSFTTCVVANGGAGGSFGASGGAGGTVGAGTGFAGGAGGGGGGCQRGGGGGAGGYTAVGGVGGAGGGGVGAAATGGGGGGGYGAGAGGGGVGIFGSSGNGIGGTGGSTVGGGGSGGLNGKVTNGSIAGGGGLFGGGGGAAAIGGGAMAGGGAGALAYKNNITVSAGSPYTVTVGNGGVPVPAVCSSARGGSGAVRIIWPGTARQFPSTQVCGSYCTVPTTTSSSYAPQAPTITSVTVNSSTQVTVNYTTGTYAGGSIITTATAIISTGSTTVATASINTSGNYSIAVGGLTAGIYLATVFTSNAYGNSNTSSHVAFTAAAQDQIFTYSAPGAFSFVVPAGVTSISIVAVGGGGSGGTSTTAGSPGGTSYFSAPTILSAAGGGGGNSGAGGGGGASGTPGFVGFSGGTGGIACNGANAAGGGGAAGYTGIGGGYDSTGPTGRGSWNGPPGGGSPGGGGGQGSYGVPWGAAGGGGVGLLGLGSNGAGGAWTPGTSSAGGGGGSGGAAGTSKGTGPGNPSTSGGAGGLYGGGGGGGNAPGSGSGAGGGGGGALAYLNNYTVTPGNSIPLQIGAGAVSPHAGGAGANGAMRIVWPGNTRSFPSTNVSSTG